MKGLDEVVCLSGGNPSIRIVICVGLYHPCLSRQLQCEAYSARHLCQTRKDSTYLACHPTCLSVAWHEARWYEAVLERLHTKPFSNSIPDNPLLSLM